MMMEVQGLSLDTSPTKTALVLKKDVSKQSFREKRKREYNMTRSGDEMILELASLLKTAEKKEEDDKNDKEEKKDEDKKDKEEKKDKDEKEEDDKKKKKDASKIMGIINSLVKLAGEFDEAGEVEASSAVDDALQVILQNIKKDAAFPIENNGETFEEEDNPEPMGVDEKIESGDVEPMPSNEDTVGNVVEVIRGMSPEEQDVLKQLLGLA
jgi:hypothetical protein